jgi:hypothetical protein
MSSQHGPPSWLDGFDAFRAREIEPLLGDLEVARQDARAKAWDRAKWVVPLAGTAIALVFFFAPFQLGIVAAFVAGGAAWAFVQSPIAKHQKTLKQRLIGRLCAFFSLDYHLEPKRDPIPRLRRLRLLPSHNRKRMEDQVSGVYDDVRLEMTELHLRQVSGSGKNRRDVTVFRGPVFSFSFPKRFQGTTLIKGDSSLIGNWLTGLGMGELERVRLEDPRFEEEFEVYGTDQVEARYLLTPAFMEELMRLRRNLGNRMQAAFSGDSLHIVANNNQNRFEVKDLSAGSVGSQLDGFVGEIGIIFEIIDTLNLTSKTRL